MPSTASIARRVLFATLRWSGAAYLARETLQRRSATIVIYHDVTPELLEHDLVALGKRYAFVTLGDFVEAARTGNREALPPKPLIVTIDDGRASVSALADVCRRHGVRPTVFLCSGIVGTSRGFWWEWARSADEVGAWKRMAHERRIEALASLGFTETGEFAERSALSRSEIEQTRDVFDYQAHTVFHPILTTCSDERSWTEIDLCKRDLEREFGLEIYAFAYPDGAYSEREVGYASRAGYACAVTTDAGYNATNADLLRLKRIGMGDTGGGLPGRPGLRTPRTTEAVARASGLPACVQRLLAPPKPPRANG